MASAAKVPAAMDSKAILRMGVYEQGNEGLVTKSSKRRCGQAPAGATGAGRAFSLALERVRPVSRQPRQRGGSARSCPSVLQTAVARGLAARAATPTPTSGARVRAEP